MGDLYDRVYGCLAIVDKQDRVTCHDVGQAVLACSDPAKLRYTSMPEDIKTVELLRAGVPATDAGALCDRVARNGLARAGQPQYPIQRGYRCLALPLTGFVVQSAKQFATDARELGST